SPCSMRWQPVCAFLPATYRRTRRPLPRPGLRSNEGAPTILHVFWKSCCAIQVCGRKWLQKRNSECRNAIYGLTLRSRSKRSTTAWLITDNRGMAYSSCQVKFAGDVAAWLRREKRHYIED